MSSKSRNFILAIFFAVHGFTPIRAAESDREATERLYREYTESYQKAAEAYEKSVKQGQTNAYVSYAVAAVFVILIFAVLISLVFCYFSFQNISRVDKKSKGRLLVIYLTIMFPIVGYFASLRLKNQA